jgi:hypothetical protein
MDRASKRRTIAVVSTIVVVLVVVVLQSGLLILFGNFLPIEADVVTVTGQSGAEREATVRLKSGTLVRATVPGACVVFPGQVATINFTGLLIGAQPAFRVWESREKSDS